VRAAVAAVDPAVVFIPTRVLRRVLRADLDPTGSSYHLLRRRHHVVARDRLVEVLGPEDLPPDLETRPQTLILLELIPPADEGVTDRDSAYRFYWRELFRARLVLALTRSAGAPRFTPTEARVRRHRLGDAVFNEARLVLHQEHLVLNPDDDAAVYVAFVVRWFDLRKFEPRLVSVTFPACDEPDVIDRLLTDDVDGSKLLDATRPSPDLRADAPALTMVVRRRRPRREGPPADPAPLLRAADQHRARGNVVRATLYRAEAVGPEGAEPDLALLASRLEKALPPQTEEADDWRAALRPLLTPAIEDYWSEEARLLYELQKACVAHERKIYSTEAVEWLLWYGQRKLVRELPLAQPVAQIRALRKARQLLDGAELAPDERVRLDLLIGRAVEQLEEQLRGVVLPQITGALAEVGLVPTNPPERLAGMTLAVELTDRLLAWGFLTFGDVRDGLARNQLKLPDLSGPVELVRGDALLRLDRELARRLDGVYRRGEVYLRYLQSLSSLAFGTSPGRLLTLYAALPFGGAFMVIVFAQYLLHEILGLHVELVSWGSVLAVGGLFFLLLHLPPVRDAAWHLFRLIGRGLYWTVFTLPRRMLRVRLIRRLLASPAVMYFRRHLMEATLAAALTGLVGWWQRAGPVATPGLASVVFLVTALFANLPVGRRVREAAADAYVYLKHLLWTEVVLGAYRAILELFRTLAAWIDRLLYTIDEWCRLLEGQDRSVLRAKIAVGVVWFYVRYTVRLVFNIFVEPQFNPLKHFPTVTVGHKLILPLAPHIGFVLGYTLGVPEAVGIAAATGFLSLIPGMFGFIVWELKENWRLYQANRPDELRPLVIGSHGERLIDLFVPGFHSGTLPRLFARQREAVRRSDFGRMHRLNEQMEHVREEVGSFVDREFVALLESSSGWDRLPLEVGEVRLALKRIEVDIACPRLGDTPLVLVFEEHEGRLAAHLRRTAWLERIAEKRRRRFQTALAGLYALAGVSLLRDPVEEEFAETHAVYAVHADGLLAWRPDRPDAVARYAWPLLDGEVEADAPNWPVLPAAALDYRLLPIEWDDWVESWRRDEKKQAELTLPRTALGLLGPSEGATME
jgi:hypothetical protein